MNENEWLADRFEEHRTHLRAVAYRMLGSRSTQLPTQNAFANSQRLSSTTSSHAGSAHGLQHPILPGNSVTERGAGRVPARHPFPHERPVRCLPRSHGEFWNCLRSFPYSRQKSGPG
jgi:hypothetical protein